jgi:hypothetical protein
MGTGTIRNQKAEGSTHLTYTGFHGGLGHLKIETRSIGERVENVCVYLHHVCLFVAE